jgi:hypothetical protein
MNINRNNYETFFLLYVDNELSPAERKAVDIFVQENNDLLMELDMLRSTALPPAQISFNNKQDLYKSSAGIETIQEDLLMYLDNELDIAGTKKIEAAIASGGTVKKEWEALKQTKLQPEIVEFKDKKVLYRHEQGRLVTMRFWSMAAAAAVIIGLLFTGLSIYWKGETQKDSFVHNNTPEKAVKDVPVSDNTNHIATGKNNLASADNGDAQTKSAGTGIVPGVKDQPMVAANPAIKTDKVKNKTRLENINVEESNKQLTVAVLNKRSEKVYVNMAPEELPERSITSKIKSPAVPIIDYNSVQAIPDNSYATTAAFNETPENDNKILYMSEERLSRSKVGGLFRKVKRVIERSTTIKTGNGVTIGGFEIALK